MKQKIDPLIKAALVQIKNRATDAASDICFPLMLGIPAMVILDKYVEIMPREGRVQKFVDLCLEQYEAFQEGRFTMDDVHKVLENEAGVTIRRKSATPEDKS